MLPVVRANPDPFSTLTVWPYGTPEGSEGPIVTTSPANLIIYNIDNIHVLDDVWLLLVINPPAYDNLVNIATNTSLSFPKAYFMEIPGTTSPSFQIPTPASDFGVTATPPFAYRPNGWPGIESSDQYNVGSLRSNLGIAAGESMWYAVGDLDSSSGWVDSGPPGLDGADPEFFTLTVELDPAWAGGDWKVLVLALGHTNDYPENPILNVRSPYTRSTLVVPEPSAILLAIAPVSALGLYRMRHKFRKK